MPFSAAAVVFVLALLLPLAGDTRAALPEGIVAVVNGEPLGLDAFHEFVGRELRHEERARELLELIVQQQVIEAEARRQGIEVTDAQLTDRLRELDAETARQTGGEQTLDLLFQRLGVPREQFLPAFRATLLAEKLVRAEFEMPPGAEVPYEKTNLWVQDRMRLASVRRTGLPRNVAAVVDGTPIGMEEFGRRYLLDQQPRRAELLAEFVDMHILRQEAARRGVALTPADVEDAVRDRRERVADDPRYADTTLDDLLQRTGRSVAWLKESDRFRNQLLLGLLLDVSYPGDGLRAYYESNVGYFDRQFGPAVHLRVIFLRAGHEGATVQGFVPRLFEDAEAELSALADRIVQGKASFADVARTRSEHDSRSNGGDVGLVRASHPTLGSLAAAALRAAPDGAPIGPIRSAEGVYLVQALEVEPKPGFEEIREHVRKHAATALFRKLRDAAEVDLGE